MWGIDKYSWNDEPNKTKSPYLLLQANPQRECHMTETFALSQEDSPYIWLINWWVMLYKVAKCKNWKWWVECERGKSWNDEPKKMKSPYLLNFN